MARARPIRGCHSVTNVAGFGMTRQEGVEGYGIVGVSGPVASSVLPVATGQVARADLNNSDRDPFRGGSYQRVLRCLKCCPGFNRLLLMMTMMRFVRRSSRLVTVIP